MQGVIQEILKAIDEHVTDSETRVSIYSDVIPHIRWVDAEFAESLREDSESYSEAFEDILDNDELLDEDY